MRLPLYIGKVGREHRLDGWFGCLVVGPRHVAVQHRDEFTETVDQTNRAERGHARLDGAANRHNNVPIAECSDHWGDPRNGAERTVEAELSNERQLLDRLGWHGAARCKNPDRDGQIHR